jgi:hypothetical protein
MRNRKLVVGAACLVVAIGAYVAIFSSSRAAFRDMPGLIREVQQLNELVSVKYSIQKVVGLKEDKVPFGSESILLVVQGTVLGGVDLKNLQERDIGVDGKVVSVRLPQANILHVYLDDKLTQVWDRRITWWTPWVPFNPDFERKARLAAVESIRKQAEEMGILRDAKRNAEQTLDRLLKALGAGEVRFMPS